MTVQFPIRFCGTGAYLPEGVRTNQYFSDYLDTTDEWITSRTGIKERRVAAAHEATSDLGIKAARDALDDAGLTVDDIDLIVCATATGDHQFPATATFIQGGLGCKRMIPAFDVSAACAGFLTGTTVAVGMISAGIHRRVLVVGAEALTRFANDEDRTTVVLFGDAAGAAIVEKSEKPGQGILYWDHGCDGSRANDIIVPAGGSRLPASATTVAERLHFLHMKGREVFKFAVKKIETLIDDAMQHTGLSPSDLKLVIPHQSNMRIIELARQRMGLPKEKMVLNIDRCGNTSAASVPMGLNDARRNGTLQEGDLVLMVAIGAGLVWCVMVIRM
ncbi:MAG: ketoacyl-ACP synthase III [Planctomycetes bacterium]|nr:ketoacyl-ACP synthase III [Planctomycetota bacterium]